MATEKVTLSYEWWEAVVEIDDSPGTISAMQQQLLFWSGGQAWIDREDGDVRTAFLKMLGAELARQSLVVGPEFIGELFTNHEGWAPLDGSFGVRLVRVDQWSFGREDISIS